MYYKCRVFCERIIGFKNKDCQTKHTRENNKICVICHSIMDKEGAYCKACIRKICDKDKRRSYSEE